MLNVGLWKPLSNESGKAPPLRQQGLSSTGVTIKYKDKLGLDKVLGAQLSKQESFLQRRPHMRRVLAAASCRFPESRKLRKGGPKLKQTQEYPYGFSVALATAHFKSVQKTNLISSAKSYQYCSEIPEQAGVNSSWSDANLGRLQTRLRLRASAPAA